MHREDASIASRGFCAFAGLRGGSHLSARRYRRVACIAAGESIKGRGNNEGRTTMRRVHSCIPALLLAVSATAWAGVEPYPEAVIGEAVSSRTRAEVIAELQEAIRAGRMYDHPYMFEDRVAFARAGDQAVADPRSDGPVTIDADGAVVVWGDTHLMRVKIQAEAAEANRLGLLSFGEGDPPVATAEQEMLIAAAGRRAITGFWTVGSL